MGKIKFKKLCIEFEDDNIKEELIYIKMGQYEINLPVQDFFRRLLTDSWNLFKDCKPPHPNDYLAFNDDPQFGLQQHFRAYWNGKYFQDKLGGPMLVTHWRTEAHNVQVLPPIPKGIQQKKKVPIPVAHPRSFAMSEMNGVEYTHENVG